MWFKCEIASNGKIALDKLKKARYLQAGCSDYLAKPIEKNQLKVRIYNLIREFNIETKIDRK